MTTVDTIAPGTCGCGRIASEPHTCEQRTAAPWCPRCLADVGDPDCCTPERLARIVTVPAKLCGCLAGDDCGCGPFVAPAQRPAGR